MKYLIFGLGNIGNEYAGTRHNIGFEVVDYMAYLQNIEFQPDRYAWTCEFTYKGRTIVLLKPTTYMNLSGKAVRYHLEKHKVEPQNILIIADDKDIPLGSFKLKPKGSGGSHNGINNIVDTLHSVDFPRLRIGIGNDYAKGFQIDFVLGHFDENEKEQLRPCIVEATEIIKNFATQGIERTMNMFNKKKKDNPTLKDNTASNKETTEE